MGGTLSEVQLEAFSRYLELLSRWNARIKLTSVIAPRDVAEKHFLDSLSVVPVLAGARTVVDVGSGAGFPGVPIALARPDLAVTLVESIQKKAAFLEAVKRELRLDNVEVVSSRVESVIAEARRFDVAVSRATWAPREWIAVGEQLVATGGSLVAMVVPESAEAAALVKMDWREGWDRFEIGRPYAEGRSLAVLSGRRPGPCST